MLINPLRIQNPYSLLKSAGLNKTATVHKTGQNSSVNLINAEGIYNRAIINFKGNDDKYSYRAFIEAADECRIKNLDNLLENITDENLIGTGANSYAYKFNDERLSNWVLKEDKEPFEKPAKELFEPTEDIFKGRNMGQEIAKAGDRYRILKKIEGIPHSVKDWSNHIKNNTGVTRQEALDFMQSLCDISNFPQESFDNYAQELSVLDKNGYKQDSINPNNLLIDYDKKQIHIIDSFKKCNPLHVNTSQDLSSVLLDFSLYQCFYEQLNPDEQEKLIEYSKKIIEKCKASAQEFQIPDDEELYFGYIYNVDKYFGILLVDIGGNYRSRYDAMTKILKNNSLSYKN